MGALSHCGSRLQGTCNLRILRRFGSGPGILRMKRFWLAIALVTASAPLLAAPERAAVVECPQQQATQDDTDATPQQRATQPESNPAARTRKPARATGGGTGGSSDRMLPLPHAQSFLPGMFR